VVLLVNATAVVGELDDIEELLADVGRGGDGGGGGFLGRLAEDGVGPLLCPGGGLEVGVVDLFELIDGELKQVPVQGFFHDAVVVHVAAYGPGAGGVGELLVRPGQDGVVGAVGVAARLVG